MTMIGLIGKGVPLHIIIFFIVEVGEIPLEIVSFVIQCFILVGEVILYGRDMAWTRLKKGPACIFLPNLWHWPRRANIK